MARIMGIDYGTRRIGIAVSDELGILARGIAIIETGDDKHVSGKIKELIDKYQIERIVIGLSKKPDGVLAEMGKESMVFAEKLKEFFQGTVVFFDEAMTTKAAENIMRKTGKKTKDFKKHIDQYAAEIILQEYLNQWKQ